MTSGRSRILVVLTSVWLIAAAALTMRLAFAWSQQRKSPHQILATVSFDQETGNIALALSKGDGFGNLFRRPTGPTAWLAPIYPWLLSLIFRLFGPLTLSSFFAAVGMNAVFSAGVTFPLMAVARRVGGTAVAALSGWLWVFLPAGVLMPFEWIWDTSLSVLLALAVVWMTVWLSESDSRKLSPWISYALLLALAILTNPAIGAGFPFLLGWLWLRARRLHEKHAWAGPVLALALIFSCCFPWTLRNFVRFHRVIPVRSSLPFELWIGNNDIFDPQAVRGIQRITRFEETRRYAQLGENAYLDDKGRQAWTFIRANPSLFLRLTLRRVLATWSGGEHPYDDFVRTDSSLARTILLINLLLTIGTLAGMLLLFVRHRPLVFPIAVFPVFFPLIYYVTHTSLRYRHPIDPLLILLTVYAIANLRRKTHSQPVTAAAYKPI